MTGTLRDKARRRSGSPLRTFDYGPRHPTYSYGRGRGPRWPVLAAAALLLLAIVGGVFLVRTVAQPDIDGGLILGAGPARPAGPDVRVPVAISPTVPGYVSALRGFTDGAVSLTANGQPVELDAGGGFGVYLLPEWTEVRLVAVDASGNQSETVVAIGTDAVASTYPYTSAVHIAAPKWNDPAVHQQVLDLIAAGRINAVQLDIKDEGGSVGYASAVPLATTTGAAKGFYDARAAIDELHGLGVRVIGRVVNFLDPTLASWAVNNGRSDMIVLDPAGAPLANNYGAAAFTNFANPEVRQYQIDLATEAAGLGFDEILYDYVRRPEGDLATMQFPGLAGPPEVSVARFVAESKAALGDTMLGISVFGISASRPEPTAQDMGLLAPNVDYVSPMVYPSLWGSGEYNVADPEGQPAEIVSASLQDFQRVTAGSGAAIVPWLQDFNDYGAVQIQAQIDAAMAVGSRGFIMWNAGSQYVADGIAPR
ncbi:MAG: putative glycoside hydrolase [Ilumatobacteraceae bacterium]